MGSLAFPRTDPFFNHMAARQVRAILGEDRWRSYFTFCFERDPWDKVISWYHFEAGRSPTPLPPFASWLAREGLRLSDWSLYADDDGPIVDFVGQFSRLEQDLGVVAERLGLPAFTRLPHSKPRRPRTSGPAVTHDAFTVELVSRVFEREIAHFGYRPPAI